MTASGLGSVVPIREISDTAALVNQPVVSVLMLAYNHAPYIAQAIASVLEQETEFSFELLIAEDCSMDATREIALKFQREAPERVRVLVSDNNVGMHANHSRAIAAARGEFMAYCEGDDYWVDRGKLQRQVEFMRGNPTCGLVHGNYLNLIEVGGAWRTRLAFRQPRQLEHRAGRIYPAMLQANRIQTCTTLSRRDLVLLYHAVGPGVGAYRIGDWPEFLYVAHEAEIGFIDQPLAAYRRTRGSVMNSGHAATVEIGLDAIRMVEEFCEYFGDDEAIRVGALSAQFQTLMRLAFRAGDRPRFEQAWDWLLSNRPSALRSMRARTMRRLMERPTLARFLVDRFLHVESMLHRVTFRKTARAGACKRGDTWG
jgi:glycosyltransferase involved in cell wall biosynthesis